MQDRRRATAVVEITPCADRAAESAGGSGARRHAPRPWLHAHRADDVVAIVGILAAAGDRHLHARRPEREPERDVRARRSHCPACAPRRCRRPRPPARLRGRARQRRLAHVPLVQLHCVRATTSSRTPRAGRSRDLQPRLARRTRAPRPRRSWTSEPSPRHAPHSAAAACPRSPRRSRPSPPTTRISSRPARAAGPASPLRFTARGEVQPERGRGTVQQGRLRVRARAVEGAGSGTSAAAIRQLPRRDRPLRPRSRETA